MTTSKADLWHGTGASTTKQAQVYEQALLATINAYGAGPWVKPPEMLRDELKEILQEIDPFDVFNVLDLQAWDIIGGFRGDTTMERQRAVKEALRLYKYNPLAQWTVWLWTAWGMGDKARVAVPDNPQADEDVQEFFTAERNEPILADDKIKEQSRWLLNKGNRFYVFFTSTADGMTTIRTIDQDEIEPICNPHDAKEVWFYKRSWSTGGGGKGGGKSLTVYYPDWKVYFADRNPAAKSVDERWAELEKRGVVSDKAKKSWGDGDEIGDGEDAPRTDAYIMFVAHNIKDENELWGWPIITNSRAWIQAHQHYMESRLTAAEARTMFVRRKKFTGGSRALSGLRSTMESNLGQNQWWDTNPSATAGSVELDNAMIDTEDVPLTTSASDTSNDNKTFSWLALLGGGLFPTSAGLDTSRFATALEMDKAQSMLFEEYKSFWAAQLKKIANIVLLAFEKWGNKSYGEFTIIVSIDTFSLADFPAIAKTIGQFTRDTITPLVEAGAITGDAGVAIVRRFYKLALDSLGIDDAADLTSDEAFAVGEPAPAETEEREAQAVERVLENLQEGLITPEMVREWMVAELAELAG
jgi:hypothetical protein